MERRARNTFVPIIGVTLLLYAIFLGMVALNEQKVDEAGDLLHRVVCGLNDSLPLLGGSIDRRTDDQLLKDGLRATSRHTTIRDALFQAGNAAIVQFNPRDTQNGAGRDIEPFGDLLDRDASGIEVTQLRQVVHTQFSGHVYNLQSVAGLYIANNIVSRNCRCIS